MPAIRWAAVRKHLGALCSLLALVSLAGCVGATPTPEPASISFAYPTFDTDIYEAWLENFQEQYPTIDVELRPKRWDVLSGLDPGDADVFLSSQFAMNWFHGQGSILSLSPFIEGDQSFEATDFYPGTMGLYTREGKVWAIPAGVDIMVMYYNQDLFDQYGVPYPEIGWTWDDFLRTTLSVRDPEAGVFGYAPNIDTFDPLTLIYQHGGRIFDDLQSPNRTTFDDPLTIEALEWYARLIFDYNVAPTPEQTRELFGRGYAPAINQGKFGVWSGMLSQRGGRILSSDWPMRWGVVTLPQDARSTTLTLVEGYFVSTQTEYPDACWKWIAYLSQQMPTRQAPVRRSLVESGEYEQEVGRDAAAVTRASMENVLLLSPELVEFEEALALFGEALEAILAQTSTPEEAMTWAQRESTFK